VSTDTIGEVAERSGFSASALGLGVTACVACCIGSNVAFLGGLSIAGLASSWLIGPAGLVVAVVAAGAFVVVRRRRSQAVCVDSTTQSVPGQLASRNQEQRT
jgi:hypothetical protein